MFRLTTKLGAISIVGAAGVATAVQVQARQGAGERPEAARFVEYRTIDGSGNNPNNPTWGTPGARLLRGRSGAHYADGASAMAGADRPSARVVSSTVFDQTESIPNSRGVSDYIWAWGQFIDHDLSLSIGSAEPAPIAVPAGDPHFDPSGTGAQTIPFMRASHDPLTGVSAPREQINEITAFIDGSMVYGSDPTRASWLREGTGGRLKVSAGEWGDLLPYNDGTMPNAGQGEQANLSPTFFVAGDIRVNEQPVLAALHTLFVREHNRIAAAIAVTDGSLDDEELFQRAREIVVAEIQQITYQEFLPTVLGPDPLPAYRGYSARVNPGIATAFSSAAFRIGHTLLSPHLQRLSEGGESIPAGPLALRDAFFTVVPELLQREGTDPLLRGLAVQRAQELDNHVIDDVRNFLFGPPGAGGLDLIALNVQRGRDMGLPDLNSVRVDYGLPAFSSFAELTSDPEMQAKLQALYGDVDNVDMFPGIFVEDREEGSMVGATMRAVLVDQFRRTRDGDRFWYTNVLSGPWLRAVQRTSLSDLIKRNTKIEYLQPNVFFVEEPGELCEPPAKGSDRGAREGGRHHRQFSSQGDD